MNGHNGFNVVGGSAFITNCTTTHVRWRPRCRCGAVTRLRMVRGYSAAMVYVCERCDAADQLRDSLNAARRLPRRFLAWFRTR